MEALHELLAAHLRKNDVYTRASQNQYSVLLTVMEDTNIEMISARIVNAFNEINFAPEIHLEIEGKIIE